MLVLKSLTFIGIGRFVEEQTINFDQLGSLVQVDAINNNTGGSSGAGKSTIFKALEFLLGLNDIPNSVLQSRLTKDPMSVTGLFDFDGLPLKIERGKKLLIDLNGEVTTGSSKLTEEKLDQIIGMPRDLFRKILHKRQGEGGFFLDMGPAEVHKFLTSCLSLEKEQSKIITLDSRLSTLTDTELSVKSAIQSNEMGLQATKSAISSVGSQPVLEITPEGLQELLDAHYRASETHKQIKSALKLEMDQLEKSRPQVTITPFDRSNIIRLENEFGTIIAQISALEKVEQDRQSQVKSKISELQIAISNLNNKELTRQSDIKNQISSLQVEIAKLRGDEQSRQATIQSKISDLRVELIKAKAAVDIGNKAKEDATNLAKELQKVRSATCPTCEQGWITDACKAKEAQILAKLSEYKKLVIAGNEASNRITLDSEQLQLLSIEAQPRVTLDTENPLNEKISQLKLEAQPKAVPEAIELSYQVENLKTEAQSRVIPELVEMSKRRYLTNEALGIERKAESDHQFKENAKSKLIVDQFVQKQTELRQQHENTIKYVRDEENKALSEHEAAKYKVKSFEENKTRFEESLNRLNSQLLGYSEQLKHKQEELSLVQEELELANESKKVIKSYLSCSFEDALDSIGDKATRLIRGFPNMDNATVQFEGLKETKEGKIKEEVTCVISMNGEIGIPVKSLSGGEKSSTDLAIDLAIIGFIEERTGKGSNLYIMDEPFQFLDTINIEQAIDFIKNLDIYKTLIIVDHNPIIKEQVENKITVVRDREYSKITV